MSDSYRRRITRSIMLVMAVQLTIGCSPTDQIAPTKSPQSAAFDRRDDDNRMDDVGLIVGNLGFAATDGFLRYDGRGRFIDNMIPVGTHDLLITCCMAFGPDENLYVSSILDGAVYRFNGVTGAFIDEFIHAGSGGLVAAIGLVWRNGVLYVGDAGSAAIRRYNAATGAYLNDFAAPGSGGMVDFDPQALEFGPDGNLYAGSLTNRVLRFNGVTGAFMGTFVAGLSGFDGSTFTFGPDDNIYFAASNRVDKYNGRTGAFIGTFVQAGLGGLTGTTGIKFGPDGNLYLANAGGEDGTSGSILRYNGKTGRFIDAFVPAGRGGLTVPRVIEFKATTVVCHKQGGKHGKSKTLTIGYLSAAEHIAHGDALGPCATGREDHEEQDR